METAELLQVAQDAEIPVMYLGIPENGSMCIQTDNQRCYIGMDYSVLENEADRRVHLAHELGHCITGSFYNRWAVADVRKKHENKADKWAIEKIIPREKFYQAIDAGYKDAWALAEHFDVTLEFMKKAMCWYEHGNLAYEYYCD